MTFVISSLPKLIGGFGLIIAATAAVSPPQSAQAQTTPPGEDSSRGLAINDLGEVVGSSTSASGDHAFICTKRDAMVDLNNASSVDLGVVLFEAHAINDKGQIIAMGEGDREITIDKASGATARRALPSTFLLTPVSTP